MNALIRACTIDVGGTTTSPFDILRDEPEAQKKARLSILTQFFLGEVNIYCRANNLSLFNFGAVLDNSPKLREVLANVVKDALKEGEIVEDKLFEFINENSEAFGFPLVGNDEHLTLTPKNKKR